MINIGVSSAQFLANARAFIPLLTCKTHKAYPKYIQHHRW